MMVLVSLLSFLLGVVYDYEVHFPQCCHSHIVGLLVAPTTELLQSTTYFATFSIIKVFAESITYVHYGHAYVRIYCKSCFLQGHVCAYIQC